MSGSIAMCAAGKSRRTMCRYGPISTSKPRKTRSRLVPGRNRSGSHGEPEASSNIGLGVALGRGGPMHHFAVSKKIRQLPLTKRGMPADQNLMLTERERQIIRSEEHTSELQSHLNLVCRLLLEKKKKSFDIHSI